MSEITDQAAIANRRAWDLYGADAAQDIPADRHLAPECVRLSGDVRDKKLLDIGCGDGFEMFEWAQAGAIVTGVDNSPVQLEAARRNATKLGLACRFIQADFLRLPEELLQAKFDIVFSASTHWWIGDLKNWFGNVRRALKLGGRFLMYSGHPM